MAAPSLWGAGIRRAAARLAAAGTAAPAPPPPPPAALGPALDDDALEVAVPRALSLADWLSLRGAWALRRLAARRVASGTRPRPETPPGHGAVRVFHIRRSQE